MLVASENGRVSVKVNHVVLAHCSKSSPLFNHVPGVFDFLPLKLDIKAKPGVEGIIIPLKSIFNAVS